MCSKGYTIFVVIVFSHCVSIIHIVCVCVSFSLPFCVYVCVCLSIVGNVPSAPIDFDSFYSAIRFQNELFPVDTVFSPKWLYPQQWGSTIALNWTEHWLYAIFHNCCNQCAAAVCSFISPSNGSFSFIFFSREIVISMYWD